MKKKNLRFCWRNGRAADLHVSCSCFSSHHLKVLKPPTFIWFAAKRQKFFMLLCSSNLHPGDLPVKVSPPPPEAFEDHPGPPGGPLGPPAFCLSAFFPPSIIQNFPPVSCLRGDYRYEDLLWSCCQLLRFLWFLSVSF